MADPEGGASGIEMDVARPRRRKISEEMVDD
jgi:hypothetical protein